ncbi:hypothetical protein Cgig2_009682 [Carnegiea gigantea]|uniref:Glutathione peroxidase n=1 Tax=Carnegiea gigantea TaxID=171969 RepID=A0A9Q1K6N5_9CARY|nr:hypothetical protein Cgig2_009682 [Carnegiea gigantea]
MGATESVPEKSIHEFTVKDSKGKDVDLSIYKGRVLLVVNVASQWFSAPSSFFFFFFISSHLFCECICNSIWIFFVHSFTYAKLTCLSFVGVGSGLTNTNYTQLTELYQKYKGKDFEILAFPCNQFMKQEPGTSEEAEQFACTRFKAEYPIFHKALDRLFRNGDRRGIE